MKKFYLLLLCSLFAQIGYAQTARDYAVELRSEFITTAQKVRIHWPKDTSAIRYDVYEKGKMEYSWTLLNTLGKNDSSYLTYYSPGSSRDFWVKKVRSNDSANGYIHASYGPYLGAVDNYGILLLVIDSTYSVPLAAEIARLIDDLEKERWEVHTHVVQRTDSVQQVKRWIEDEWMADSSRVKSLLLLGHVPVPYSGNFNPDAHPDHQGAWPADVYYVTFGLNWTDNSVNTTTASRSANRNVPGDNKFDQDYIWPELAKIPMGRVDLYDMPSFGSDTLLMKRYLDKNHAFRTGELKAEPRALIDDNFGAFFGEAFASNGWRVFTPMFDSAVYAGDYFGAMGDSSYLFSYGCGGGTYTSAGGIGSSSNFANDSLLNPFSMIFGSYFGDWDNSNNFLRAPLASKGWGLASAWAGRPLWMFHHAAVNEPIGFAAMQSQNAWPTYEAGYSGTYVHIALMGDPSLRLYPVSPVSGVAVNHKCYSGGGTRISWNCKGNDADSVEIWVRDGNNAWLLLDRRLASDSFMTYPLTAGQYTLKIYAMDWVENPSGFFKVLSHPLELNFNSYTNSVVQSTINKTYFCDGDTLFYSDNSTITVPYERMWDLNQVPLGDHADSFIVLSNNAGVHAIGLTIEDSLGCLTSFYRVFELAPPLSMSVLYQKADILPACDSLTNVFELSGTSLGIQRALIYWGDSSAVNDTLVSGAFSWSRNFPYAGTYTGRIYGYDSSGNCMIHDSFETFVAPNPAPAMISPNPVTVSSTTQDFRASYFDAGMTYNWGSSTNTVGFIPGDSIHKVTADFYQNFNGLYGISLVMTNQFGCNSDTSWALVYYLTSVKNPAGEDWKIYPNPSQGKVSVRFDQDAMDVEWVVLSMLGKEVSPAVTRVSDNEFLLDMSDLPAGTYLIRVRGGKTMYQARVVRR